MTEILDSLSDILKLECDEDGTYIVTDYKTVVYGDAEAPLEALRDYIVSLIEYSGLLLGKTIGDKPPDELYDDAFFEAMELERKL